MKKLLPLLLVLLLLAGCGNTQTPETSETTQATIPEEPKGLYDPDSSLEKQTKGAVRLYRLEKNDYFSLSEMGSSLLLCARDGSLRVLRGQEGIPAADLTTDFAWSEEQTLFDVSAQGIAYYDSAAGQVVLLNPQLQEAGRITLPEDMVGLPKISMDRGEVFYCVPGQIRALDIHNDISRLIRSHTFAQQELQGVWFDGQVLQLRFTDAQRQQSHTEFISAETGKTLYAGTARIQMLSASAERYAMIHSDGDISQTLVGTREGQAQVLNMTGQQFASALVMGGVIGYTTDLDTALSFYDLESGKCTAKITLNGITSVQSVLTTENAVWILAQEGDRQVLCQWNMAATPCTDETVYTSPMFTAQNPDLEGLAACQSRAEQLSETYGIKIHVWEDTKPYARGEKEPEYQVQTLDRMLTQLSVALEQLPESFLDKTVDTGWIHVSLVRALENGQTLDQYWDGDDFYICATSTDDVTMNFYRGIACAADSHVIGNSRKFDDWNDFNPEGFTYSYSYALRADADTYLNDENSAFLSHKALAYPLDDRAEVFCYAMLPEAESYFQNEAMQAKLELVCRAIREAYGLEKSPETYPWEQYLQESLAYTQ